MNLCDAGESQVRGSPEFPLRVLPSNRTRLALLVSGLLILAVSPYVCAQEDANDAPLGDVARSLRKKPAPSEAVIDNDNLSQLMDDAEAKHAAGTSLVFSLDPAGRNFQVSSPDVTCSLSFSAKTSVLVTDPILLDELPRSELAKLDGPATIDGDSLQVSMHNGTSWELREVVIGLTIIRRPDPSAAASYYGLARIVPAVAGNSSHEVPDSFQKQPDVTVLLRVKGSAAPATTALFRTQLNFALFPDQEWHWAIVKAKGIPPPTLPDTSTMQPGQAAEPLPPALPGAVPQILPPIPPPSNSDAATQ